ncbi:MAG: fatty acyl-AMP ligase [Moorea sp. SIO3C2]|nr:fatty acyl-AMP ligase [Moorena sp. SIO3C2]
MENIRGSDLYDKFNLVELWRYRAHSQPAQIAYTFNEKGGKETARITYEVLEQRSRAYACQLKSVGVTGERALLASISTRYRLYCCFLWVLVWWRNCSARISTTETQSQSLSVVSVRIRCRGSVCLLSKP